MLTFGFFTFFLSLFIHPQHGETSFYRLASLGRSTTVAVGTRGTIARTTDAGTHWDITRENDETQSDLLGISLIDSLHG
jgi:photosystem II stability/assembly factor-like uncharacterized protein